VAHTRPSPFRAVPPAGAKHTVTTNLSLIHILPILMLLVLYRAAFIQLTTNMAWAPLRRRFLLACLPAYTRFFAPNTYFLVTPYGAGSAPHGIYLHGYPYGPCFACRSPDMAYTTFLCCRKRHVDLRRMPSTSRAVRLHAFKHFLAFRHKRTARPINTSPPDKREDSVAHASRRHCPARIVTVHAVQWTRT